MAAFSSSFLVNCSANRPSVSRNFNHDKAFFSTSIKPYVKEVLQIPSSVDIPKVIKETSVRLLDAFVDLAFEMKKEELLPLQSNFAPVEETGEPVPVTAVEGGIPYDFPEGIFIRNGPNPSFGGLMTTKSIFGRTSSLWVEGEGMLHALNFQKDSNGTDWNTYYNNKYVLTETLKLEKERNRPAFLPATEGDSMAVVASQLLNLLRLGTVNKILSNTIVFEHSGKTFSIAENDMPREIDIETLETFGDWDLIREEWNRPFNSHPKRVPGSGELVISGNDGLKPHCVFGIISADGKRLVHKVDLKFDRSTFCHEMGITKRLVKYEKDAFARIGIMPHYGDADSIRWFAVEPCSAFHVFNCLEDGDEVVCIACKAADSILPGPDFGKDKFEWFSKRFKPLNTHDKNDKNPEDGLLFTRACEWRLNMQTGEVKEKNLTGTEFSMDFPIVNERFIGLKNKYGYAQVVDSLASSKAGLPKYGGLAKLYFDEKEFEHSSGEETTKVEYHMFPENTFCTGAAFVPKPRGLGEDDGWIITFTHNENTNTSQAYIVDAKKFTCEPVAKIALPSRVPYGFHGTFFCR